MKKRLTAVLFACAALTSASALPYAPEHLAEAQNGGERVEFLPFGNFDQWLTRHIKESAIMGGQTKTLYEIAPTGTWNNNNPYNGLGGSPWACSNVLARVVGITKTNTSVYKEARPGHGYCAKLYTHIETCKALGINIKVLAAGSLFLGHMIEPITGVSNPMKKLDCGIKFTKKPKALCFDYKVKLSGKPDRIRRTTGVGSGTKVEGMDMADCILFLQKRWEDADGNIYAKRIGTMVRRFNKNTDWVNNARFEIHYGDITKQSFYRSYMGLTTGSFVRYAKNSKGKMVKVQEVGWGSADETPTHLVLQFDSSHGGAYVGSEGNTFWIDNVRLVY